VSNATQRVGPVHRSARFGGDYAGVCSRQLSQDRSDPGERLCSGIRYDHTPAGDQVSAVQSSEARQSPGLHLPELSYDYCGVKTIALCSVAAGSVTETKPAVAPAGTVAVR